MRYKKRYAEYSALVTVGLLTVYFLIFTIIATSAEKLNTEVSLNSVNYTTVGCSLPRYIYDSEMVTPEEVGDLDADVNNLKCSKTRGIESMSYCLNISGCSWEIPTTVTNLLTKICKWLGMCDSTNINQTITCLGNINASHYNIPYRNVFGTYYANLDNVSINSVCDYNITSRQTCQDVLSCTWTNISYTYDVISGERINIDINRVSDKVGGIFYGLKTMGKLLTFSYDFNLDNGSTGMSMTDFILTIIFIYIPLIITLLAVYGALPFI